MRECLAVLLSCSTVIRILAAGVYIDRVYCVICTAL